MEIVTTQLHTGGMPLRIIESGFPQLYAPTLLGKRREVMEKHDKVRSLLMAEPRGHSGMYGALLCESELEQADMAVLFMDNACLSTMCGHGVICAARYAVSKGLGKKSSEDADLTVVNVHCPCGLVEARVRTDKTVAFTSVPAFVVETDVDLKLHDGKTVKVDVSYGGAFYAILDCTQLGIDISTDPIEGLINLGAEIKKLTMAAVTLKHPDSPDLCFVYGTILTDGIEGAADSKSLVIFGDRQPDRSPCGSGTTARLALEYYKGKLGKQESKAVHNSRVAQSTFVGRVLEEGEISVPGEDKPKQCVRVEISGKSYFTGRSTFVVESDDFISNEGGFLLKD